MRDDAAPERRQVVAAFEAAHDAALRMPARHVDDLRGQPFEVGFDEAEVSPDRLGLAGSVRARIEDAGGSVRVFARPGVGTTVLLTVPRAAAPGLIGSDA